jgi:SHS2 domain-containing protein
VQWEHFPHGSDVGVRGWGSTPATAFEQAALALTAAATSARVEASEPVEVSCQAPDLELLFVEWLNSVIYEMAVRRMLFARFSVRIEGARLKGTPWRAEGRNLRFAEGGCRLRRGMVGGLRRRRLTEKGR